MQIVAAIDIGSNGIKFLISQISKSNSGVFSYKTLNFSRLPIRLGDDVFEFGKISDKTSKLLQESFQAFAIFMKAFGVTHYRACATSAMRDAKNGTEIISKIEKSSSIKIDIISGQEESKLIFSSIVQELDNNKSYIHIDIGGGSTEISLISNAEQKALKSFNIGAVRLKDNKVAEAQWRELDNFIETYFINKELESVVATGGSLNKLFEITPKSDNYASLEEIKRILISLSKLDIQQKIENYEMSRSRAEIIDFAGIIFNRIIEKLKVSKMSTFNFELKDGIIRQAVDGIASKSDKYKEFNN